MWTSTVRSDKSGASVLLFTTPVAQQLVTAPGKFSSTSFVAASGVSQQGAVKFLAH